MSAEGLLPSDICFFCGDRIPAEVNHNPKDIYRCEGCTGEVLRLDTKSNDRKSGDVNPLP